MKITIALFAIISVIALGMPGHSFAMPSTPCDSYSDVSPKLRRVCDTLSTLYELGAVMEQYIEKKVPEYRDDRAPEERPAKRQLDKDHVYLRFGKRR